MPYYVRSMRKEDVEEVIEIDREAFPTQWPQTNYEHELRNRLARYIVACDEERIPEKPEAKAPSEKNLTGLGPRLRRLFSRRLPSHELLPPLGHYIIGFAGFWVMAEETHITNIAVREAYRRQGVGELLLMSILDLAKELKSRLVTLEVRASNTTAQNLYAKYGFTQVGVRRGYYVDRGYHINNREDGLIMTIQDITSATFQVHLEQLRQALSSKWGMPLLKTTRWLSV